MSDSGVSADEIVALLVQPGSRFVGLPDEARREVARAVQIAREYCALVVEDAARWAEQIGKGDADRSPVANQLQNAVLPPPSPPPFGPPERPVDGLFCIEMEAGLHLGPWEGGRRRQAGVPPYIALRAWLQLSDDVALGNFRFAQSEFDRWTARMGAASACELRDWSFRRPQRHGSLNTAVYRALVALQHEFAERPTGGDLRRLLLQSPVRPFEVREGELFIPGRTRAVKRKDIDSVLAQLVGPKANAA